MRDRSMDAATRRGRREASRGGPEQQPVQAGISQAGISALRPLLDAPPQRRPLDAGPGLSGSATGELLLNLQRSAGNGAIEMLLRQLEPSVPTRDHVVAQRQGQVSHLPVNGVGLSARTVQRDTDVTNTSITPDYAKGLSDAAIQRDLTRVRPLAGQDDGARENLKILLDELSQRRLQSLAQQGQEFAPEARAFRQYCDSVEELEGVGGQLSEDPDAVGLPSNRLLAVSEDGSVVLLSPQDVVQMGDDLIPVLDRVADASNGDGNPGVGGRQGQVILWEDGRALSTPPVTADFARLVLQGRPGSFTGAEHVTGLQRPWERVRDASMSGLLRSGIFQLGTYPVSKWRGVSLPAGSRIRFADPAFGAQWRFRPGLPGDTRFMTIFQPGTRKYFAWDAHAPVGSTPHDFYHVNQKGMHALFGQSDHAPIPASELGAARGMRWVRIGGRVFLVVGVGIDAALLTRSVIQSTEQGSARPAIAQAVRTVGSWGGAWAGAKLVCVGGAVATVETGPGAILGCIAGGIIGGFAGYYGADWIADMISED